MSLLARATRGLKSIDQEAMADQITTQYLPLYDRQTWTGLGVSNEAALNIITVYQCVKVLAETFAQIPLILYRRLPNGGSEEAVDHPWYGTLNSRANPEMTAFVWRELMMSHRATWGNGYSEIVYDQMGRPQLWPVNPARMEVKWGSDSRKVFTYVYPSGTRQVLDPTTVFHLPGMSSDGLVGFSPITLMRKAIGLYQSAEQFGTSLFANNARPATVLSHPKTLSKPAVDRLASQMEELRGSANAGKTVVLEEGLTVTEVGIPPEDAQFMQTRLFQKREIAAAYRLPLHKVGDYEHATFSNIEELNLDFIQDTMMPWFERTEQEVEAQLIDDPDIFAEHDVDEYLRGDPLKRSQTLATRYEHGTINADEWRAKENENPIEGGLGQRYYMPVNYAAVVPAGQEAVAPATVRETITQPVAPGSQTVDPVAQAEGARLTVIKSMKQFDCPDCGKLVNRLAAPGTIGYCKGCKSEKTFGESEVVPPDPLKSMSDFATVALASQSRSADRIAEAIGGLAAAEANRPIHIAMPKLDPTIVHISVPEQKTPVIQMPKPAATRRRIEHDSNGRPVALIEEPI